MRPAPLMLAALAALALSTTGLAQSRTYTTDADFDEGVLDRVNHLVPDQLQLDQEGTQLSFLHVACSGRDTVCRIDVETGAILGEYSTAPDGLPKNPSGISVDGLGNVWTGNRDENATGTEGSVVQLGVIVGGTRTDALGNPDPNGQYLAPPYVYSTCVDRDGDGLIRTSRGGGDVLAWPDVTDGQGGPGGTAALVEDSLDECILVYQKLDCPNVRHLSVDAAGDVWVGGYPGVPSCFRKLSGLDGSYQAQDLFFPSCGGFSGLIDPTGVLWSTSFAEGQLLRADSLNTPPASLSCIPVLPSPAGMAADPSNGVWVAGGDRVAHLDPAGAVLLNQTVATNAGMFGIATTSDGSVWAAASLLDVVYRLDGSGAVLATIPVGSTPIGLAVDVNGKVWVVDQGSDDCRRIDPATNAVDLVVALPSGAGPFTLGDFARSIPITGTAPVGSWSVVFDSSASGTQWGTASWGSSEANGAALAVTARSAESSGGLGGQTFVPVQNGVSFTGLAGRFIELRVDFAKSPTTDESPVLFDLTITGEPAPPDDCISEDRRQPGSLLLFPEFDNRPGDFTVFSITNTACGGGADTRVEFRYIDGETCREFNRREELTACDTLTLLTSAHNPNQQRGYAYAYALDPVTNEPAVFEHLVGQLLIINGIDRFDYATNAVAFRGIGDGVHTDLDTDGIRDLDGIEYSQAPDEILIPRFFGQTVDSGSELVLVALSGGAQFTSTLDFLIFNDNEEAFSGEHSFDCWDKVRLLDISGVFGQAFLANATADDPDEVLGANFLETGWLRIDGALAQSTTTMIHDPAFYAVLVDRIAVVGTSDLPFEWCSQANGKLLPRTNDGER